MDDTFSGTLCFPENICSSNSQVASHVSDHPAALQYKRYSVFLFYEKTLLFFPLDAFCIFETFQNFGRCFDITQHHIIINTTLSCDHCETE